MTFGLKSRVCALVLLVPLGFGAAARAQEACTTYVVQDGDTLGEISMTAYGRLDYQTLFNANSEALRGNATLVAGTELRIPCEDGRLTAAEVIAPIEEVAPIEEGAAAAPAVGADQGKYRAKIRFATGGDWYPFADEGLTGGGFLIRLGSTAMNRASNDYPFKIDWVDDWDSHLTTLLPNDAFDISIAWYQIDCTALDQVSEMTRDLCLNYFFFEFAV